MGPLPKLILNIKQHLDVSIKKVVTKTTKRDSLKVLADFISLLNRYEVNFENMNIPFLAFTRGGRIHFVSKAFREMTGFELPVPTKMHETRFYNLIKDDSLLVLMKLLLCSSIVNNKMGESIMMPAEVLCYNKYVECYLTCTLNLDHRGLPLLFAVTLQPKIDKPIIMSQLPQIINQSTQTEKSDSQ